MVTNYKVIKRDGHKVPFNVMKIKKVLEWAAIGLNINTIELESQLQLKIRDGMSTNDIQQTLIDTALSMTNMDDFNNLKWRFVAARLQLLNLYKEAKRTRKYDTFGYGPYYPFVKLAVKDGIYDKKILEEYTPDELREMGRERDMRYDYDYDFSAMNLFKTRYLLKNSGKVFELPQDMYLTVSLLLALPEKKKDRLRVAKQFYHSLAARKISPGTPVILNLRRPGGNLASCFITAMDDSLDSIYYTLDQLAQISKNAGGVGVNLSRLRSHGAAIKGIKGASGGVLPWVKLINDTAVAVNQLGSRSGAITVALDVWHKDVEDFLDMQTENGDQRKKSFDVFPQLAVTDLFMKRVEGNKSWTLVDPHEIRKKYKVELAELYGDNFTKLYEQIEKDEELDFRKEVSARELFKTYLKTLVETGMPYLFFKDTTNHANPNKHCGMIGNANLCTESFSNFKPSVIDEKELSKDMKEVKQQGDSGEVHTCNLVSLNFAEIADEEVDYISKLAVRMLDNTIDVSKPPLPEAHKHNDEYRILGIGALGLADYLAAKTVSYTKAEKVVDDLFERCALAAVEESAELAKIRGAYANFKGSDWSKGTFFGRDLEWYKKNSKYYDKWKDNAKLIKANGMRNGGLFAIAPNTSTSLLMGSTASVLPIYRKFFVDKASNGAVPVVPPFLNEETFWVYKENQNIDQKKVVDVVSTIQKWIDQGISMEVILNIRDGMRAKDIYDLYLHAWKKGCKTVYYARSITHSAESAKEECISCAN